MEKLSLLEKLKTLQQWQLQQQLDFAKIKANSLYESEHDQESEASLDDEDKENANSNSESSKQENSMFTQTMTNRALTEVLSNIQFGNKNNALKSQPQNESRSSNDIDVVTTQNRFLESGGLSNWHMSGLETAVYQDVVYDPSNGIKETPLTPTNNMKLPLDLNRYILTSGSEDEFSEVEMNDDMDGIHPISETEEEEEVHFECDDEEVYDSEDEKDETIIQNDEVSFFVI